MRLWDVAPEPSSSRNRKPHSFTAPVSVRVAPCVLSSRVLEYARYVMYGNRSVASAVEPEIFLTFLGARKVHPIETNNINLCRIAGTVPLRMGCCSFFFFFFFRDSSSEDT